MNVDKELTTNFWNVQLQLLEMYPGSLLNLLSSMVESGVYKRTSKSKKFGKITKTGFVPSRTHFLMGEEDRQCLATHLALQLAGVEE